MELIKGNNLITRAEIANVMNMHESSVQRRLDALVKEGNIKHIGPTNGGYWEVIE